MTRERGVVGWFIIARLYRNRPKGAVNVVALLRGNRTDYVGRLLFAKEPYCRTYIGCYYMVKIHKQAIDNCEQVQMLT